MMKFSIIVLCLIPFLFVGSLHAQIPSHFSCGSAKKLCESMDETYDYLGTEEDCTRPLFYFFHVDAPVTNLFSVYTTQPGNYTLYYLSGEGLSMTVCEQLDMGTATVAASGVITSGMYLSPYQSGLYVLRMQFDNCFQDDFDPEAIAPKLMFTFNLLDDNHITCPEVTDSIGTSCKDCITSFSPTPGKYMVSAWVKEEGASINTVTYTHASLGISFTGGGSPYNLLPSGRIIDGWQRIEGVVEVPALASDIHLTLQTSTGDAYFDDIRFYPLDGSMLSYVYDPINLRMMAELDERNYATFYEYDEEGKLIRVKKETERGIMTIKENRDNIRKQ